jgi:hypothetical protein
MSDAQSNLSELASFVGQSALQTSAGSRNAGSRLAPAPKVRHSVTELLGVVLTLSARTRRVVQPRVEIDLDVFTPGGGRALRIVMPRS